MEDSNDNFMNDSDDDTDNSLGKRSKRETKLVKAINSEDESDDNDEDYRTKPAVSSTPTHNTQSPQETNCSEDEDASASFANGSDEGPPPSFNAPVVEYQQPVAATNIRAASTWQNPLQSTAKKNSSSGSSIASQSDEFDQSIEGEEASLSVSEAKRPSMVILSDPAPAFGEASASGVCEEEVFDEEAVAIEPISTLQSKFQADPAPADSTNIEPNFDYSMDFSDDEVEAKEPIATVQSPIALSHHSEDASKSQSFDGKSGGKNEQSEYFESDDGSQLHEGEIQIVSEEQEMPSRKNSLGDEMPEDAGKLVSMAKHEQELEQMMPPEQCYSSRAANTTTTTDLEATDKDTSPVLLSSARQRVVIIREYDRVESEKPEMKDVSTQFTGNHAGIQAELVPEGMHNLFPRCSIQQEQPHLEPMSVPESTKRPTDPTSSSSFPPPPPQMKPPSPSAGNYEYSMGQIHSPSTSSSTSVYKQQLIELQRQIQLKKQETEKLVRDRMAFQYSTFRGTERVRTSPSLAKEIALRAGLSLFARA